MKKTVKTLKERLSETLQAMAVDVTGYPDEYIHSEFLKHANSRLKQTFKSHAKEMRKFERLQNRLQPITDCTIDGEYFDNILDACAKFNISLSVAVNRFKSHYWPKWQSEEIKKVITVREKKTKPLQCTIDGVTYVSIAEAARALNTSTGSVFYKLRSNNYPEWKVSE